jgi:hypothetical protein
VAADLGEGVKILKVDTDENPELSSQLQARVIPCLRCCCHACITCTAPGGVAKPPVSCQERSCGRHTNIPALVLRPQIQGLPTMVFVGTDTTKPALRTEGLLPAETIKQIVADEIGG